MKSLKNDSHLANPTPAHFPADSSFLQAGIFCWLHSASDRLHPRQLKVGSSGRLVARFYSAIYCELAP